MEGEGAFVLLSAAMVLITMHLSRQAGVLLTKSQFDYFFPLLGGTTFFFFWAGSSSCFVSS